MQDITLDFTGCKYFLELHDVLKKAFGFAADDVHRELTHEPPPETIEERNARIARDIEKYGEIIISQDDFLDIPID